MEASDCMLILNDLEKLKEISPNPDLVKSLLNAKLIIETKGILLGMGKIDFYPLLKLGNFLHCLNFQIIA